MRTILHVDFNGFYASCECVYRPWLRDVPMAVSGEVELRAGIILAKNQLAKKYKIKTGEPIHEALAKCPDLTIVPPQYRMYDRFSKQGRKIFESYSPRIEPFGMDECWMDLQGTSIPKAAEIANEIRIRVKEELGLTASVGVSFNKIFAKLGSEIKKPDATTVFTPEDYKETVWKIPAHEMIMVGRATTHKFKMYGIHTIGDIAKTPREFLKDRLGKHGEMLWIFANGLDQTPVCLTGETLIPIKTVGNSNTAPRDMKNDRDAQIYIEMLSESVAARLREYGLMGNVVQIAIKDNEMGYFQRQCRLPHPTQLAEELAVPAFELFKAHWDWRRPLRAIGIRACNVQSVFDPFQISLVDGGDYDKKLAVDRAMDDIHERFGARAIVKGFMLEQPDQTFMDIKEDNFFHPLTYIHTN